MSDATNDSVEKATSRLDACACVSPGAVGPMAVSGLSSGRDSSQEGRLTSGGTALACEISLTWEHLNSAWLIAAHAFVKEQYDVLDWFDDHACHCTCPGEGFHESRIAHNHCRIYLDPEPVPTISCFHNSCAAVVTAHNKVLRQVWRQAMSGDALKLDSAEIGALGNQPKINSRYVQGPKR